MGGGTGGGVCKARPAVLVKSAQQQLRSGSPRGQRRGDGSCCCEVFLCLFSIAPTSARGCGRCCASIGRPHELVQFCCCLGEGVVTGRVAPSRTSGRTSGRCAGSLPRGVRAEVNRSSAQGTAWARSRAGQGGGCGGAPRRKSRGRKMARSRLVQSSPSSGSIPMIPCWRGPPVGSCPEAAAAAAAAASSASMLIQVLGAGG